MSKEANPLTMAAAARSSAGGSAALPSSASAAEAWWRHYRGSTAVRLPLARGLFYAFLLVLPVTDVLSFSPWLPPPLMMLLLLGFLTLLEPRVISFVKTDFLLGLVVLCTIVPFLWSMEFANAKTAAHLTAFVTTLGIYYLLVRSWLQRIARDPRRLQHVFDLIAVSTFATACYIFAEFLLVNVAGLDPSGPLPHLSRPEYLASVLHETGALVSRARGFASESGIMALFFELAIFASFFSVRRFRLPVFLVFYAAVLGAFVLLFSVGGMVALVLASTIYGVISGPKTAFKVFFVMALALAAIVISFPEEAALFFDQTILHKLTLLTQADAIGSAGDRIGVYRALAALLADYPLGIGIGIAPAIAESGGSYNGHFLAAGQVSLYGFLLVSGGLLALLAFAAFFLDHLWKALQCGPYRGPLFMAGMSLAIHHLLVTEYWLPTLWFYFALVGVVWQQQKTGAPARPGAPVRTGEPGEGSLAC